MPNLSEEDLAIWQRILRETPIKYENMGKPEPFGYGRVCPQCGEPLFFHGEPHDPPGVTFLCIDCKTVWFESNDAEYEHAQICEEKFEKETSRNGETEVKI